MTDTASEPRDRMLRIKRLLVTLDASADCLNALDELASLANRMELELSGVLVEDTDLLDLAGHRIVTAYPTRVHSPLAPEAIERTMRNHVNRARRAVAAAATRRRMPINVEVRRGRTALEVVRSARDEDLIVISRQARGFTTTRQSIRPRAGPTTREVVRNAQRSVFVLGSPESLKGPLYLAFDGTAWSARALDFALAVCARSKMTTVTVLLMVDDLEAHELKRSVLARMATRDITADFETVSGVDLGSLAKAMVGREESVLVLGGHEGVQADDVQELIERVGCSVLLVR